MDEILAALGLDSTATSADIVDSINALKAKVKGLPKDIDPKVLSAKMAAGLDQATAISVMRAQAEADAAAAKAAKTAKK